jgi:hypothetical protein
VVVDDVDDIVLLVVNLSSQQTTGRFPGKVESRSK